MTRESLFIIGSGQMAIEYAKVLKAQNKGFRVIGRGKSSASKFHEITGIEPVTGGLEEYLLKNSFPQNSYIIIATGTESLMTILLSVLKSGVCRVLVEKPAAISIDELLANEENLKPHINKVFVAYNRRFYSSVIKTIDLIKEDGGLKSMHFEFTEWAHVIESIDKFPGVKENWFFANSTHVVDLAFYIAGYPVKWMTFSKTGKLSWHKKTNFSGAGITEKGTLFSYISNWESAGRWGIELMTERRRIFLRPLEQIHIQNKGTIKVENYEFDNSLDTEFKPGLYLQVDSFLNSTDRIQTIAQHIMNSKMIYKKILE
ncbi:MAG: Gfo/Idh/MocA family oxidoreductase [Bacteroidales bacterium]|nr:Gfo/Idh/MocA family oxidoreductase [Bacteroidales bacterium]